MARTVASLAVFLCVAFLAGLATVWGLQSIGMSLGKLTAGEVQAQVRPSYVSSLHVTNPDALNVALATPVVPVGPAAATIKAPETAGFTHTVAVESLRVRSGPNKMTPQIFALKGGSKITVIREERGWVMVEAGQGRVGWVYPKFLRPAADAARDEVKGAALQATE